MRVRHAAAAALVAFALSPPAAAQEDAFRAGLDARDARKWQEVAAQMRRAIEANPQESTSRVRSGLGALFRQGGMEYLPHYFLGEALFNLKDCAGALHAWSTSERQGAVTVRPEFGAVMRKGYAACETIGVLPPARYDPLLARTRQQVTDVSALAANLSTLGGTNIQLWHAGMKEQYDGAAGELRTAQARLAAAGRTRAARDFADAGAAADRARQLLSTLEANLNAAIAAQRSVQAEAAEVERIIVAAESYERSIVSRKTPLPPPLAAARQSGREALSQARDRLGSGVRASNASALNEARTLAQQASARFKQVLSDASRMEKEAAARQAVVGDELFAFIDGAFATLDRFAAERAAAAPPDFAPQRDTIAREATAARRRFDAARRTANLAGLTEATRLASEARDRLNALISAFGPMTLADRGVHPALAEGARRFLAGRYEEAVSALSPPEGFAPDMPLRVHVHLFRAAALHALFLRSGGTDESLRAQALADAERCRALNPELELDRRAFSPRFIGFFQQEADAGTNLPPPPHP